MRLRAACSIRLVSWRRLPDSTSLIIRNASAVPAHVCNSFKSFNRIMTTLVLRLLTVATRFCLTLGASDTQLCKFVDSPSLTSIEQLVERRIELPMTYLTFPCSLPRRLLLGLLRASSKSGLCRGRAPRLAKPVVSLLTSLVTK